MASFKILSKNVNKNQGGKRGNNSEANKSRVSLCSFFAQINFTVSLLLLNIGTFLFHVTKPIY